ncbi:adaptin ear-binding coat-associated protein 1 NECAP-1 [Cylindrobasidium torrendii FP15055 ss-10]|uniref:Adaptin ear-binding coat-associated protein 1 NECAP-1 n=1 Tax=Cylindrobasidium torrendii FP15055 ss-10 TaxID=1314674 RepID=A0A0D7B4K0_9AGAR|nr:adaptin ear-binding coat-associated protein 1 NECAP-1 [Cylindrobasidium torrendii FP15055 ss-10]
MEGFDEEIESILYICREISIHKIPPLKKNEGHRAGEWGDLAAPIWKGRLRFIEKGNSAALIFDDPNTGELFARAEYEAQRPPVEAVLDSSRYFVVRVEDAGKKAYIGLGFLERTDSFDFNVACQDYEKRWTAAHFPKQEETPVDTPSPHVGPKKDYSLKEGQTFTINIPGRNKPAANKTNNDLMGGSSSASGGLSGIPLLPPPPSSTRKR